MCIVQCIPGGCDQRRRPTLSVLCCSPLSLILFWMKKAIESSTHTPNYIWNIMATYWIDLARTKRFICVLLWSAAAPLCFFHFSFTSLCSLSHRILIYLYCKVLVSKWVCGFYLLVCTRRWHRLALLFTELLRWASCASFGKCAGEVFPTSTAVAVVVFIFVIV